jgi:hypothetical protein
MIGESRTFGARASRLGLVVARHDPRANHHLVVRPCSWRRTNLRTDTLPSPAQRSSRYGRAEIDLNQQHPPNRVPSFGFQLRFFILFPNSLRSSHLWLCCKPEIEATSGSKANLSQVIITAVPALDTHQTLLSRSAPAPNHVHPSVHIATNDGRWWS